jgi:exodeoxyribonuclease-3
LCLIKNGDVAAAVGTSLEQHPSGEHIHSVVLDSQHPTYRGEGRLITVELDSLFLVAAYVPNSGQTLDRLDYRVDGWDIYIREYLANLRDSNDNSNHKYKGVVYCGDMNVGHLDVDIYNHTAKHIVKQAGLTPRERASFTKLLEGGWRDSFRYLHPCKYVVFVYILWRTTGLRSLLT